MAGIMHFSAFFRFMEGAEHAFLRSLGFSVFNEQGGAVITFPRVAASCEFHSPARCEDMLDIAITVARVGTYRFDFSNQGRAVAKGTMTSVCCRIPHGGQPTPIPIPDVMGDKLRALVTG
jgi:4-hydroxybenzoyl-CoA thioesterase/acyl-CoA thioester hydrolase